MSWPTRPSRSGPSTPWVRDDAGGAIAIALGAVLERLALLSSTYQRYVRRSSRDYIIAAGAALIALGVIGIVRARAERCCRRVRTHGDDGHGNADDGHGPADDGHGHADVPGAAVLLLAPIVAVFCVAPPALGPYAARRAQTAVLRSHLTAATGLPPSVDGAVTLKVSDFIGRVDVGQNLAVGRYRLSGFVMPDPRAHNGEFSLTRLQIVCCAADAQTMQVPVAGISDIPAEGTWVTVVGSEIIINGYPELQAISLQRLNAPTDPYE